MKVVGLIPARGGSKGLPGKNIRLLNGKPMLWYTMRAAIESKLEAVVVSSDSAEILEVARNSILQSHPEQMERCHFHKRPDNLATDISLLPDAIEDVIDSHTSIFSKNSSIMVLQPTSPVRKEGDIDCLIDHVIKVGAESVVAVSQPIQHPGDMVVQNQKSLEFYIKRNLDIQRQQYEFMYFIVGSHYFATIDYFRRTGKMMDATTESFIIDTEYSIDVDDIATFRIAEAMIQYLEPA